MNRWNPPKYGDKPRMLYPSQLAKLTKQEFKEYYLRVSQWLEEHHWKAACPVCMKVVPFYRYANYYGDDIKIKFIQLRGPNPYPCPDCVPVEVFSDSDDPDAFDFDY